MRQRLVVIITPHERTARPRPDATEEVVMNELAPHTEHIGASVRRRYGHHWMMLACCIPMLLIVIALVVTGVASASAIIYALVCVAMMTVIMAGMGHGHGDN